MRDEQLEKVISEVVTPCAWSTPANLQIACIVARDVALAYKAKLELSKPVAWIAAEQLAGMHRDDRFSRVNWQVTLRVSQVEDCEIPLYAHPMPTQAQIKDTLLFAAKVIELYDNASVESADYMLTATDCAEIIKALAEYMEANDVRT